MCGITGCVDFLSGINSRDLERMTNEIVHRGPDSTGSYQSQDGRVGLAIRRLSIIDLQTGNQPIKNEDGSVVVVFNGEIYNYLELKKRLTKAGHKFRTKSDTEVLVHLYEEYGEKMNKHLNGMFAYAIWDRKNSKLFLARDNAGIKPLYYYVANKSLVFASEIKSILKYSKLKKSINHGSLANYCYMGYFPGEETIFEKIYKLLPGHSLTFTKSGVRISQYFKPSTEQDVDNINLDDLLFKSVKKQMMSDVPLGVFLSGGLDSSLVALYLSRIKKDLKTFSISFSDKSFDEGKHAYSVAKKLGTDHHNDYFSSKDVLGTYDKICGLLDEPFADPSLFPTYKVSKLARKSVKVVLSGDGGDELFGGYPTYQGHLLADKISFIPNGLFNIPLSLLKILPSSYKNYAKKDVLESFFKGVKKTSYNRHLFWMSLLNQGQKYIYKKPNLTPTIDMLSEYDSQKLVRKMQLLDYHTYLRDSMLFKVDRASMYNSLEVRVPFLDPEVISYAFSIKKQHVNLFNTKIQLRKLLKDQLPSVARRPKKGFGIPVARWINSDLSDLVGSALDNQKLYDYFNKNAVNELYKNHKDNKQNNARIIWAIVMFSGWLDNWY